ncbi:MAG: FAD:protein FMN transferase [Chitinophagia bacterium]|jgi:thiamine biosynthesis lipoprotein|nr:FAD:protein FMN transferase [Chitinophagia bacterium]
MKNKTFKVAALLMGNQFEISAVSDNEENANKCINAGIEEIKRIEKLLTTFHDSSETNSINRNAGIEAVKVSEEIFNLIERSIRISSITQGAFDITYGSIDKSLWNFDTQMNSLPDKDTAKEMVRLINYQNIVLDRENTTVFLREKGMRIGFGGIGKGYAAEKAKNIMQQLGIASGIVNASGDLTTWGFQPNGEEWTVGIANPNISGEVFSYLKISGLAVATSGNYEKYIMIDGKKYSHTIDPRTGLPVTGIKSVTIITKNAEIADAMATPVTIMGVKAGLHMINQMKDIEVVIIDDHDKIHHSTNIRFN